MALPLWLSNLQHALVLLQTQAGFISQLPLRSVGTYGPIISDTLDSLLQLSSHSPVDSVPL